MIMDYIHIIMCWIGFVLLVSGYLIAKVCVSHSLVANEEDFIHQFIHKKADYLKVNEISMTITAYLAVMMIMPVVLGVTAYLAAKNAFLAVLMAIGGFFVPEGLVLLLKRKAGRDFETRYARSLEQLASSLKAGFSILQAVQEVAENKFIHESMREKYRKMGTDLQMGISVSEAFKRFAKGTASQDAEDVAIAIDIQNEVGGHEADVIMSISKDIHDRIMLRYEIKSLFSGTSSMVYIMDFIPVTVIVFLFLTDNSYARFYFSSPLYMLTLCVIVGLCILGSMINHGKISKIMKGV